MLEKISVTILTKDSARYISEVLSSLSSFGEVVLFDTGSTDITLDVATKFSNVSIHRAPFKGFGPTHNQASSKAKFDWILSIDSDEVISEELIHEISLIPLDPQSVYSFPRHNYYKGKWIKWCGWYPDRQIRLYNRTKTCFSDEQVHEKIISKNMKHIKLRGHLKHYSYNSAKDFLHKMQSYSELFALQNCGKKNGSMCQAVLHGTFTFFKSYIIKRGFLGGKEGFEICVYNANTAFYKYLKLGEANARLKKTDDAGGCD